VNVQSRIGAESLTALDARRQIEDGTLTASHLLEACLERIDARDDAVKAWVHIDRDGARRTARELDAGPSRGLLHGIPFGVKDIIDTWDQPATYGSPIYKGHQPPWDGSTAALPRAAGAVLLGKTVTTEFANRHPGPTMNPHNPEHTPGGSSSGSAAAVADHQVPLAIGTQTGGSVIRPSAYCGAYGYKPSLQHFGNAGVRTNTASFDTVGIMARSVGDLALFRAVLSETPYKAPEPEAVSRPRIAFCRTPHWDQTLPETHAAMEETQKALTASGAEVFEMQLPDFFDGLNRAHKIVCGFESVRNYSDELRRNPDKVSQDFMKERVEVGWASSLQDFREALRLGIRARTWLDAAMADGKIDAILTPPATGEAPHGLRTTGTAIMNFIWTHCYMPAVTLPRFKGPNGLPVGVQFVGRRHEDTRLLSLAAWADATLMNRAEAL
jgi:Asp-tRNA(Asn)/Glu-tRNA(Gln) amidotransferase A subunit family amidase